MVLKVMHDNCRKKKSPAFYNNIILERKSSFVVFATNSNELSIHANKAKISNMKCQSHNHLVEKP